MKPPPATRREKRDPSHQHAPIPRGLQVLIGILILGGLVYLLINSGGFSPNVFGPPPSAVQDQTPAALGKRVYIQNCLVCHQASGQGAPRLYPPLVQSEWVLGTEWAGDNHLVRILLNGLTGPIEVNGQPYIGAMVGWGKSLNDEKIAAVLTYIRSEWGNQAPPITPEFVAQIRQETADRSKAWTQRELQAIPKSARHDSQDRKDLK